MGSSSVRWVGRWRFWVRKFLARRRIRVRLLSRLLLRLRHTILRSVDGIALGIGTALILVLETPQMRMIVFVGYLPRKMGGGWVWMLLRRCRCVLCWRTLLLRGFLGEILSVSLLIEEVSRISALVTLRTYPMLVVGMRMECSGWIEFGLLEWGVVSYFNLSKIIVYVL